MSSLLAATLAALLLTTTATTQADQTGPAFATPEQAIAALDAAVARGTKEALTAVFGAAAEALVNPDEVQGRAEFAEFRSAFQTAHRLVAVNDNRRLLEIGAGSWPFPIPIEKQADGWRFNTTAGLEELLNRRIGRNELDVLRVLRACIEAQREFATRDLDADGVREFAQSIASSPGATDGLFWPPELNGELSPLGPLIAFAQAHGYAASSFSDPAEPQPFRGYFYKILTRQGRYAPGGKHNYIINGNMIAGFAFVAWPAAYGESGVMTFMVNQQGRILQRDLGPKTAKIVARMRAYDPSPEWQVSPD